MICYNPLPSLSLPPMSQPNLPYLAYVRRQVAAAKAENIGLVRRELCSHHASMTEYCNDHMSHLLSLDSQRSEDRVATQAGFDMQPQINPRMRALIFDFIMYSHTRLNLCTATLFLTFDILDRYASRFIIKSGNYQLLALTALWLASKYWDAKQRVVNLATLCQLCCNQYTRQNFKDMELHLLKSLNWDLYQTATYDAFIDMILFLKKDEHDDLATLLNPDLNINEVKLGAIVLCELLAFDIKTTAAHDTYTLTKAVVTLLSLSLDFQHFNKWRNINDVCSDEKSVAIMNQVLQICANERAYPSSFKFKHFNKQGASPGNPGTVEKLLQNLANYNHKLQAEEFARLQQFDMFNDPFSSIFNDDAGNCNSSSFSLDTDDNNSTTTTPRPGSITPLSSVSSSSSSPLMSLPPAYSKQAGPFVAQSRSNSISKQGTPFLAQSRSNSLSTLAGLAPYLTRHRSVHGPLTPTTPTMFRKPSIRKMSSVSKITGLSAVHQRKRSASSTDVVFEQCQGVNKR